jgi:hypothetical protein
MVTQDSQHEPIASYCYFDPSGPPSHYKTVEFMLPKVMDMIGLTTWMLSVDV